MVKKEIRIEKIRDFILRKSIEKEIKEEMGREPMPGEVEKIMERRRKYEKRIINPVKEYYGFYLDKVKPLVSDIKDKIEKSKTKEIKMYTGDYAIRTTMIRKSPFSMIIKSKPVFLIEGISVNLGDKGKFITMRKAIKEERLTGFARKLVDRICLTDPQTDNPRILEFQSKICQIRR